MLKLRSVEMREPDADGDMVVVVDARIVNDPQRNVAAMHTDFELSDEEGRFVYGESSHFAIIDLPPSGEEDATQYHRGFDRDFGSVESRAVPYRLRTRLFACERHTIEGLALPNAKTRRVHREIPLKSSFLTAKTPTLLYWNSASDSEGSVHAYILVENACDVPLERVEVCVRCHDASGAVEEGLDGVDRTRLGPREKKRLHVELWRSDRPASKGASVSIEFLVYHQVSEAVLVGKTVPAMDEES